MSPNMLRGGCLKVVLSCLLSFLAWQPVCSGIAWAQGTPHRRTVVLRLEFVGSVNEVSRDQLARRLFEGLASAGFQVYSADETVARLYESTPALKTCGDATCFRQMSAALQANFLVIGKVDASRRDYDIKLRLIEGRTGQILASSEQRCEVCGIQEAGDTVSTAAEGLRTGLEQVEAPAQVTVETMPMGALVEVDGQPLGFTPLTHDLSVGVHEVVLTKPGYQPNTRSIEVKPGSAQMINVALAPQPGPFLSTGWKVTGWLSLVTGMAAMGVGTYLLKIQDTCAGKVGCADRFETRLPAAALLGGGGLLAGFGGLVVFVAPSVVRNNVSRSDAATLGAHSSAWQVVVRGNF